MSDFPKVSCLMVTADRAQLCRRAVLCFQRQTYPNKELVVVDDGTEDLAPILAELPDAEVKYVKLRKEPGNVLGRLRNRALDESTGTYLAQWDDDDWYHPERLERQVRVLEQGYDACTLSGALMHLDTPEFFYNPYIGYLKRGVPGTIVHRRDASIRYPELPRAEDSLYLRKWMQKRYVKLPRDQVHLFIRCFHGRNTWEVKHFLTRMRNTRLDLVLYMWYRFVRRDLFKHPRFRLTPHAREAFENYLQDSYELRLLDRIVAESKQRP
jgi:glycosyltransferase involved in cell wall biosynthesis